MDKRLLILSRTPPRFDLDLESASIPDMPLNSPDECSALDLIPLDFEPVFEEASRVNLQHNQDTVEPEKLSVEAKVEEPLKRKASTRKRRKKDQKKLEKESARRLQSRTEPALKMNENTHSDSLIFQDHKVRVVDPIELEQRRGRNTKKAKDLKGIECPRWTLGECILGEDCMHSHSGPGFDPRTRQLCRFARNGKCNRSDCIYSHDLKVIGCVYFHRRNGCSKLNCPYSHDPLTPEQSQWLDEDDKTYLASKPAVF